MTNKTLSQLFFDYFLHIQINTLNLPYYQLPRPYKSNKVSRLLRKLFEKNWIKRVFGLNLATAMLLIPALNSAPPDQLEPHFNINATDLVITESLDQTPLTTKEREFVMPVERLRYVGQYFRAGHPGYDLNSYIGDDVLAFSAGRVHYIENGTFGLGRYIILDHGHGLISVYAHLKSFNVFVGEVVDAGDKIGEVGMTGYTTGPHLHFEVHDNGRAVNPALYLKF